VLLPASQKRPTLKSATIPTPKPRYSAGTVLVVDDEEMLRKLAVTALRSYGYEVLEAQNGAEALDVLAIHSTAAVACAG